MMLASKFFRCHKSVKYFCVYPSVASGTRKVGKYKRTSLNVIPRDQLQQLRVDLLQDRSALSTKEWHDVRQLIIDNNKHVNDRNIDAVILGVCNEAQQLALAKDYVQYLVTMGVQPNSATLGRLLRVYNAAYKARGGQADSLSPDEQNEVINICTELRSTHELLDATSCENLILGLVTTMRWRTAKELLEMSKLTSLPSTAAYTELAIKAFSADEMKLGWQLLQEMLCDRKQPKCDIFLAYLKGICRTPNDFQKQFEKLIEFLQNHELIITEKVVHGIEELAQNNPTKLTLARAKLSRLGQCSNCGSFMQNISITDAEFAKLSDSFLHKVLIRQDVFQKSTPEEVQLFKRYVDQTQPYDCVIDGLNVAYSMGAKKSKHFLANLLISVAKYFHKQKKHVLILGRQHMNSWPNDAIKTVRKYSSVFLTNNLTHDDPFILYATIKSGQSTDFFSRDLMRAHAYLLGPDLKSIFRRWQQEHQYSLVTQTANGKLIIKEPTRHLLCTHKVNDTWHIPYKLEYSPNPPETFDVPKHWLCLKFQK